MDGFWHGVRMATRIMLPLCVIVFVVYADIPLAVRTRTFSLPGISKSPAMWYD